MENTNTNTNNESLKGVRILRSFYEGLDEFTYEEKGRMFEAIMEYGLNGVEPNFDDASDTRALRAIWKTYLPVINNSINRAIISAKNGNKGGAPKKFNDVVEPSKTSNENKAIESTISTQPIPEVQVEEKVSEIEANEDNNPTQIKLQELMVTDVRELSEFKSNYNCYIPKVLLEYMYLVEGKLGLENKLKKIYNQTYFNIDLLDILKEQHNKEVSIKELAI
jgi:hypothetical protein